MEGSPPNNPILQETEVKFRVVVTTLNHKCCIGQSPSLNLNLLESKAVLVIFFYKTCIFKYLIFLFQDACYTKEVEFGSLNDLLNFKERQMRERELHFLL